MANELNLSLSPAQTGLTVTAILIQANAQVGSSISCPESGTVAGHYSGNMPAISAGVYGVNFLSSGQLIGSGSIDWDGAKERGLVDLPTVAQVEARTLPSAEYFNPSTDAVSTVTNLTNLPVIPNNWITAAGISSDAITKIQTGLATASAVSAIPTTPLLANDIRLDNLDATISSRSNFDHTLNQVTVATNNDKTNYQLADNAITSNKIQDGALTSAKFATGAFNAIWSVATRTLTSISDSAGVTTLLSRVTDLVPTKTEFDNRTLPSNQYSTASNLDTVLTRTSRFDSLIENTIGGDRFTTKALETAPSGDSAATIYTYFTEGARADAFKATGFSTLTANQVWEYTDRSLTGTQATNLASIANIPTNPLLVTDIRIDDIKAKTDQLTFIEGNVVSTLNGEEVAILNSGINAIVSGINGTLVIPTAVQIRTEIDTNSTELAAIKTIAIGARNNAAAGL